MELLPKFKNISCFVFDMDGVLTDGTLLLLPNEVQVRRMNIKDGLALKMAIQQGYCVYIISGSFSTEAKNRFEKLGVTEVHFNINNKFEFLSSIIKKNELNWDKILFMGDDLPDIEAMKAVGVASCPSDAIHEVKSISHYISPLKGGKGCVRDVIEKVLKLNGHWQQDSSIASHL